MNKLQILNHRQVAMIAPVIEKKIRHLIDTRVKEIEQSDEFKTKYKKVLKLDEFVERFDTLEKQKTLVYKLRKNLKEVQKEFDLSDITFNLTAIKDNTLTYNQAMLFTPGHTTLMDKNRLDEFFKNSKDVIDKAVVSRVNNNLGINFIWHIYTEADDLIRSLLSVAVVEPHENIVNHIVDSIDIDSLIDNNIVDDIEV